MNTNLKTKHEESFDIAYLVRDLQQRIFCSDGRGKLYLAPVQEILDMLEVEFEIAGLSDLADLSRALQDMVARYGAARSHRLSLLETQIVLDILHLMEGECAGHGRENVSERSEELLDSLSACSAISEHELDYLESNR